MISLIIASKYFLGAAAAMIIAYPLIVRGFEILAMTADQLAKIPGLAQ